MKRVTICVLLYGDYTHLAKRCLDSIINNCDRNLYEIRIGMNQCCRGTIDYVLGLDADKIYISRENVNKCPMMRQMFKDISTEWIWWFDDDSHIVESNALSRRLKMIDEEKDKQVVMYGHVFFFSRQSEFDYGTDVIGWIEKQKWYTNKKPPCGVTHYEVGYPADRWFFATGGNWIIKTSVINEIEWPSTSLVKRNDDVLLCEAIRQSGYKFIDCGDCGVNINDHTRRGSGEDKSTMVEQMKQ